MKHLKHSLAASSIVLWALGATAFADEQKNISILVNKTDDQLAKVDLKINGQAEVFDLPKLEKGESRIITTSSGKVYTVNNTDGDMTIITDTGENISLPKVNGDHMIARIKALHTVDESLKQNNIRIMGSGLSEGQKQIIKDAIASAGVDKEVVFSDGNIMFFPKAELAFAGDKDQALLLSVEQELEWTGEDGEDKKHIVIKQVSDKASFNINFENTKDFTDILDSHSNKKRSAERLEKAITKFLMDELVMLMEKGKTLSITFTDIDRAGDNRYDYASTGEGLRVVKDTPIVRLKFQYSVADLNGNVIKSGEENLSKIFTISTMDTRKMVHDPYHFEKKLLKEWLDNL